MNDVKDLTLEQQEYVSNFSGSLREFYVACFREGTLDCDGEGYIYNQYGQVLSPLEQSELYYDAMASEKEKSEGIVLENLDRADNAAIMYISDKEEQEEIRQITAETREIIEGKSDIHEQIIDETFENLNKQLGMEVDKIEEELVEDFIKESTNNLAESHIPLIESNTNGSELIENGIEAQKELFEKENKEAMFLLLQQQAERADKQAKTIDEMAKIIEELRHPLRTAVRKAKETISNGYDKAIEMATKVKESVIEFAQDRQRDIYMAGDNFNNRIDNYLKEFHQDQAISLSKQKAAIQAKIDNRMKIIHKIESVKIGFKNFGNVLKASWDYAWTGKELPPRITEVDVSNAKGFLVSFNQKDQARIAKLEDKIAKQQALGNFYECNIRSNANKWKEFDKANKFGKMLDDAEKSTEEFNAKLEKINTRGDEGR